MVQSDYRWRAADPVVSGSPWSAIDEIPRGTDQHAYFATAYAMVLTHGPQFLIVEDSVNGVAHAVVAYRIGGGLVFVADPNHPGDRTRAIPRAGTRLGPYYASERADLPGSRYDRVFYAALTAYFDWAQLGARWKEFDSGTVGMGKFPSYRVTAFPGEYPPLEVRDGVAILLPQKSASQTMSLNLRGEFTQTTQGGAAIIALLDGAVVSRVPSQEVKIALHPGENDVGVWISSRPTETELRYVDFQRYTFLVRPAETPTPAPTRRVTAPPQPPSLRVDGTYDYSYAYRGPGGRTQRVDIPAGFVVRGGRVSSNPAGYFGGSVDASGAVRMSGACHQTPAVGATWTGLLRADGSGGGSYDCGSGGNGTWSVRRR